MPKKYTNRSTYLSSNKPGISEMYFFEQNNFLQPFLLGNILVRKFFKTNDAIKLNILFYKENREIFNIHNLLERNKNITKIQVIQPRNDYPPIFGVSIEYREGLRKLSSKGVSLSSTHEALIKAFGEYLERYNGYISLEEYTGLKKQPVTKEFNSKNTSLEISFLPHPCSFQEKFKIFPKKIQDLEKLAACQTFNSTLQKKELLPLACLYYNVYQEVFLQPTTTNGGGGGVDLISARLSAVYELIERDHFLLFWVAKISPPKITIDSIPEDFKNYILKIKKQYNLDIYFLNTSYELDVFSCITVIVDPVLKRVSLGGSSSLNVSLSIKKSFSEALTELHASEPSPITLSKKYLEDYIPYNDEKITKRIRKDFYNSKEGVDMFTHLFLQGEDVSFNEVSKSYEKFSFSKNKELEHIINNFKKLTVEYSNAYNLYFYEYSSESLKKNNYIISKAYVPVFLKLWLEENTATPFSERVVRFASTKNTLIKNESDLNPLPHPFS